MPEARAATVEEYWPDMEGLEHRDTVTDFGLPQGTFFDAAVVHVLTTATLDGLRARYPEGRCANPIGRPARVEILQTAMVDETRARERFEEVVGKLHHGADMDEAFERINISADINGMVTELLDRQRIEGRV